MTCTGIAKLMPCLTRGVNIYIAAADRAGNQAGGFPLTVRSQNVLLARAWGPGDGFIDFSADATL